RLSFRLLALGAIGLPHCGLRWSPPRLCRARRSLGSFSYRLHGWGGGCFCLCLCLCLCRATGHAPSHGCHAVTTVTRRDLWSDGRVISGFSPDPVALPALPLGGRGVRLLVGVPVGDLPGAVLDDEGSVALRRVQHR